MYYDPRVLINEWFTEHCLICGSINHIFVDVAGALAWECYFCSNKFWIDDLARDQFILREGVSETEADVNLQENHYCIKYLLGRYERLV